MVTAVQGPEPLPAFNLLSGLVIAFRHEPVEMDFPAVSQLEGYASGKITGVVFSRVEFRLGFIEIVLYGKFPVKEKIVE